jgi:hypothetical protein
MTKFVTLAAASMLTLAGATAFAQTTPAPAQPAPAQDQQAEQDQSGPRHRDRMMRHHRFDRADFEALSAARLAGVPAGLKLNADQQKLWGPVEQALQAMAQQRLDRMESFRQNREANRQERPDLAQRLDQQAQRQTQSAQHLTALADAMKPFWSSLDDNQKRLLPVLLRPRAALAGHGRMDGRGHGWHQHADRHEGRRHHADRERGHGMMDRGQMGHGMGWLGPSGNSDL